MNEGAAAPYMSQSHARIPSSMSSYSVYSTNMVSGVIVIYQYLSFNSCLQQQQQYPDAVTIATSHGPHSTTDNSYSQINVRA